MHSAAWRLEHSVVSC